MNDTITTARRRIAMIDEIRGFCIIAMVFHHIFYDLVYLFKVTSLMPFLHIIETIRLPFVLAFIIISGLSSRLSRSNARRGFKLLGVALAITLFTFIFMPEQIITFGILHMLALCMLIFAGVRPLLDKVKPTAGILIFTVLFMLTYNIEAGQIGIPNLLYVRIPSEVMAQDWLFAVGIPGTLTSADYFPIFPWLFAFMVGSYIGVWAKQGKFPGWMIPARIPFLSFVGSKTLIIYVLHQPVVFGILTVLFAIFPVRQ